MKQGMRFGVLILLGSLLFPQLSVATETHYIDEEDVQEVDIIVQEPAYIHKVTQPELVQPVQERSTESKVVILNNQKVVQGQDTQVSQQPIVQVIGTSAGYAQQLRKSRQEAEIKTEQKIVEKLEGARLRDEQGRLGKLFKESVLKEVQVVTRQPVAVSQYIAPVEIHQEDESYNDEIYMSFQAGRSANLDRTVNLNSYGSFGVAFGSYDDSGLILESAVLYSRHNFSDDQYDSGYSGYDYSDGDYNVHQFTGTLALKLSPFASYRFRPYVGLVGIYSLWMQEDADQYHYGSNNCSYGSYCDDGYSRTNSIGVGINVGVDMKLTKKFGIGTGVLVNVINVYSTASSDKFSHIYDYNGIENYRTKSLEETNWLIASINAKLYF